MAKYTVEIGAKVIKLLHEKGYQNAKLIGSLGAGKESEHDIDVFIPIYLKHNTIAEPIGEVFISPTQFSETSTCFSVPTILIMVLNNFTNNYYARKFKKRNHQQRK